MKKVLIHTFPVMLVFISLILINNTFNPLILKGPDFLKFYLMLVFGFYASILILQIFKERISEITYCFTGLIFLLGIVKMTRGILLGKPVGFLLLLLFLQIMVFYFIRSDNTNPR